MNINISLCTQISDTIPLDDLYCCFYLRTIARIFPHYTPLDICTMHVNLRKCNLKSFLDTKVLYNKALIIFKITSN